MAIHNRGHQHELAVLRGVKNHLPPGYNAATLVSEVLHDYPDKIPEDLPPGEERHVILALAWDRLSRAADPEQQKDTSSIPVDAGARMAVLIPVHDWPVLTVEVSSGSSPDTCIMLGYKFLPLESANVQPSATLTPSVTPSPAISEPSTVPSLR